jgi:hypothetical protein
VPENRRRHYARRRQRRALDRGVGQVGPEIVPAWGLQLPEGSFIMRLDDGRPPRRRPGPDQGGPDEHTSPETIAALAASRSSADTATLRTPSVCPFSTAWHCPLCKSPTCSSHPHSLLALRCSAQKSAPALSLGALAAGVRNGRQHGPRSPTRRAPFPCHDPGSPARPASVLQSRCRRVGACNPSGRAESW